MVDFINLGPCLWEWCVFLTTPSKLVIGWDIYCRQDLPAGLTRAVMLGLCSQRGRRDGERRAMECEEFKRTLSASLTRAAMASQTQWLINHGACSRRDDRKLRAYTCRINSSNETESTREASHLWAPVDNVQKCKQAHIYLITRVSSSGWHQHQEKNSH